MDIDYSSLPAHMVEGAQAYIEERRAVGQFLTAVICNDLFEAFARADGINIAYMHDWIKFFYNEAPSPCYGSPAKMKLWLKGKEGDG